MTVKIVEELRQVAFPDFPHHRIACEAEATDLDHGHEVVWICDRQVNHEGPHMATYEYDGEGTIIGLAWTDKESTTNDG